jgi:hypothetical protein
MTSLGRRVIGIPSLIHLLCIVNLRQYRIAVHWGVPIDALLYNFEVST